MSKPLLPDKVSRLLAPLPQSVEAPIRLDANESYIPLPISVAAELAEALANAPLNRYPDPLAAEVCALAASYYGVLDEQITAGCGSDELIGVIVSALIPQGGRVLLSEPDFGMYRFYAELRECVCVSQMRRDGVPDIDALLAQARPGDLIILSNPCNPTGRGIRRAEMESLIDRAPCLVAADEAYMDFWDQSVAHRVADAENLVILRTASKSMGLAGIRLGFALACKRLTAVLRAAKSPYNVSVLTQTAGAVVLRHGEMLRENARRLRASAASLHRELSALLSGQEGWVMPETVTNFMLLTPPNAQELYDFLLTKGIRLRLLGDTLRVTGGSEVENQALLEAIQCYI